MHSNNHQNNTSDSWNGFSLPRFLEWKQELYKQYEKTYKRTFKQDFPSTQLREKVYKKLLWFHQTDIFQSGRISISVEVEEELYKNAKKISDILLSKN